jgi:hypothetical protein
MTTLTAPTAERSRRTVRRRSWQTAAGLTTIAAGAAIVTGTLLPWVETFAGLIGIPGIRDSNGRILAAAGVLIAAQHESLVSISLAAAFVLAGAGVVRGATARPALILAVLLALFIWVAGEDVGGILTGHATDPDSGSLLILLAVAFWPARSAAVPGQPRAGAAISVRAAGR